MRFGNDSIEGNIAKYNLYKVFTKRVFLPLISIFLIEQRGVTLAEIAVIASVTAIVSIIMEIPSGYIADRWGHKKALSFGTFVSAISVLAYIFIPGFWGGMIASVGFFAGSSFASGTAQAFMHETLLSLGRDDEYSRVMGRAQSYGLIGNIFLISAVPLTYGINPIIPFVIGFICLFITFLIVLSFRTPEAHITVKEECYRRGVLKKIRELASRFPLGRLFLTALIAGIASSGFTHAVMYREIRFAETGIPVGLFGILLALGSLFAAIGGKYIHLLEKIPPVWFYLFDVTYLCVALLFVGVTGNPWMLAFAFALFPTYDRTRNIVYEAQFLREFPYSKRKSTMLSVLSFFELAAGAWIPLLFSFFVGIGGLSMGHTLFGAALATILIPLIAVYGICFRNSKARCL